MGSKKPEPGKCGARLRRNAGFCTKDPVSGSNRCRMHGAGGKAKPGGRPIVHGKFSARFARDEKPTQDLIDKALQDPELLNARRPVALQSVLVTEFGVIPDEDTVIALALESIPVRVRAQHIEQTGEEPIPMAAQMLLARRRFMAQSMDAVSNYQRAQESAARQVALGELIAAESMPLFAALSGRLRILVDRWVPEKDRDEFLAAYRREVRHLQLELSKIGED